MGWVFFELSLLKILSNPNFSINFFLKEKKNSFEIKQLPTAQSHNFWIMFNWDLMSNFSQVSEAARMLDYFIQLHNNYRTYAILLLNYLLHYKQLIFPIQLISISFRYTRFWVSGFFYLLAAFNGESFVVWGFFVGPRSCEQWKQNILTSSAEASI